MFALKRLLRNIQTADSSQFVAAADWETLSPSSKPMARLPGPRLSVERMHAELLALQARRGATHNGADVDLTNVSELASPWTIHLALLIQLARRLEGPLRLRGLHGQPFEVAWLYRADPEVGALLASASASDQDRASLAGGRDAICSSATSSLSGRGGDKYVPRRCATSHSLAGRVDGE
jgi:hypothetical protein